jgi:hypothetical protein
MLIVDSEKDCGGSACYMNDVVVVVYPAMLMTIQDGVAVTTIDIAYYQHRAALQQRLLGS